MSVTVKVTTKELKNTADNMRAITDRILNLYAKIREEGLKLPAQWEGDAEGIHRQKLNAALEEAQKLGKELKERPGRLLTIAGVYETTEQQNVAKTADLKLDSHVIS